MNLLMLKEKVYKQTLNCIRAGLSPLLLVMCQELTETSLLLQ